MEQLWQISPAFGDSWISDMFTTTEALQKTFASQSSYEEEDAVFSSLEVADSLFAMPVTTPTVSAGSENELPPTKKRRIAAPPTARATKRKSRASKRTTTTFITADPAHFREMVQQVTGANFGRHSVMKTEPHRLQPVGVHLPTLDSSSAFFLDGPGGYPVPQVLSPAPPFADGGVAGLPFEAFCSYPTLESWKVVKNTG